METRLRVAVVLALVAVLFVPASATASQNGPAAGCQGADVAAWPAANYASDMAGHLAASIVSQSFIGLPHERSIAVSGIPAGTYVVDTVAYDGSPGRESDPAQPNEQFVLQFLDEDGAVIAATGPTVDLTDFVEETTWAGSLGQVVLDRVAVTVRALHVLPGVDTPTANSVMPVCVGWTVVPPPTTTTPPTTAAPTTTTTVPTQVLPEVQEMPDPDPVVGTPNFTG